MVSPGNVAELDDSVSLGGFFFAFWWKALGGSVGRCGCSGDKPPFFQLFWYGLQG